MTAFELKGRYPLAWLRQTIPVYQIHKTYPVASSIQKSYMTPKFCNIYVVRQTLPR